VYRSTKQQFRRFASCIRDHKRAGTLALSAAAVAVLAACGGNDDHPTDNSAPVSQFFAQTNDATNAVLHFIRNADGTLKPLPSVPTGGRGTNGLNYFAGNTIAPDALTSNNSVIVSPDNKQLFVANAGDNTISVFNIDASGQSLSLLAVSPTNGVRPTSIALHNGILYVTHQQGAQELGAYRLGADGRLTEIGHYTVLKPDALATETSISPDGKFVVVNGFLNAVNPITPGNMLLSFPINTDGTLGAPNSTPSIGVGPFGGVFGTGTMASTYFVSDAAGVTADSYSLLSTGAFAALSGPISVTGQTAPCWVKVTPDNHFAYISSGSGVVSLFAIDPTGKLSLLNVSAAAEPATSAASTSSFANDSWMSADGKFLYQDFAGDDKIVAYAIGNDGSLNKLGEQPANTLSKISLQGAAGI
jgi:6-phosphogluconolactonase